MRYSDIKRIVDELLRDFLRKVDRRLAKAQPRTKIIRMGMYGGDI